MGLPKLGVTNATPDLGSGGVGDAPRKSVSPSLSKNENAASGGDMGGGSNAEARTAGEDSEDADSAGSTSAPTRSESEAPTPFSNGVPNRLPEDVMADARKAERDAARAERRAAASGGSGETASIGGAPKPPVREALQALGRHAGELNRQLANDKSTTHISIDHRHHD